MSETDEVLHTLDHLQTVLADLAVRGLRSAGPQQIAALKSLGTELERMGAGHLAGRVEAVLVAVEKDDRSAAPALLRAQASVRVFERVLTLEAVAEALHVLAHPSEEDA